METDRIDGQWQAAMNVAVAMKKEGLDTGDAIHKLRDAKVLLNLCKFDEHAHSDELREAETAVDEAQGYLINLIHEAGRESDFSFEVKTPAKKKDVLKDRPTISKVPGKTWAKVRLSTPLARDFVATLEGVDVIEEESGVITILGSKDSIKDALQKISKVNRE